MRLRKLFLLVAVASLFFSCSTSSYYVREGKRYRPTDPDRIRLYYHDIKPSRQYKGTGYVVSAKDGSMMNAYELFLKTAADMGADAVIKVAVEVEYGYWSSARKFSGVAVKYVRGGE